MNRKTKGWLQLLGVLAVICLLAVWGYFGYTKDSITGVQDIKLGLDLDGGVSITYKTVKDKPTSQEMEDTIENLRTRAEAFSTESNVYQEGSNRINVEIPGVDDAQAVLTKLGAAGNLYFIYACDENGTSNVVSDSTAEHGYSLARTIEEIIADGDVVMDGSCVSDAEPNIYTNSTTGANENVVELTLNGEGTTAFAEATEWCVSQSGAKNQIAIVYDGTVISCPSVNTAITGGKAQITNIGTYSECEELATFIRIGALPIELETLRSNVVGATLGSEALKTSLIAGVIGFALVCLFMIVVYRILGVAASLALVLYLGLNLICYLLFDVTLTLPGIAGVILTVGMAVDANVIIFTRIREEIASGKTVRSAIKLGFSKATSAIVDGNVTTLIAAAVLYMFGSGTIKGFAITLGIGIVLSMISALLVTRFLIYAFYNMGIEKTGFYGIEKERKRMHVIEHKLVYCIISGAAIVLCIVMLFVNRAGIGNILNYGLDFVGGTSIQVTFNGEVPANSEIESLVKDVTGKSASVSAVSGQNALIIKTETTLEETGAVQELKDALGEKYGVAESSIETETISGTISGEMKRDAIISVVIAIICMLIYIFIRFRNIAFAGSAVLALVHDVLVVLCLYAVSRMTVDSTFIAVMLTLVGYSINATIVIFDRIRENLPMMKAKDSLEDVVNDSITQTFTRSINTSLTTLITVVVMIILGVDTIRLFAIPLAVGIICGTYSSVCITGTLWYLFVKKKYNRKTGK